MQWTNNIQGNKVKQHNNMIVSIVGLNWKKKALCTEKSARHNSAARHKTAARHILSTQLNRPIDRTGQSRVVGDPLKQTWISTAHVI